MLRLVDQPFSVNANVNVLVSNNTLPEIVIILAFMIKSVPVSASIILRSSTLDFILGFLVAILIVGIVKIIRNSYKIKRLRNNMTGLGEG